VIKLSVVIPIYNEEQALSTCLPKIIEELDFLKSDEFEIVLVDDGSTDRSQEEVRKLSRKYPMIRLIGLPSNQGQIKAIHIGLSEAKGDCVASLDLDLQDPPEHIKPMYEALVQGDYDCVQAVRISRESDSLYKRWTAEIFYRVARWLTEVEIVPHAGEFRILKKNAVERLLKDELGVLYLRTAIPYQNLNSKLYPISRGKRHSGVSRYDFWKMFEVAVGLILSIPRNNLRYRILFSVMALAALASGLFIVVLTTGLPRDLLIILCGVSALINCYLIANFRKVHTTISYQNYRSLSYKELNLDQV
jgi:polyisoprenyl-phosphate glycosyltransferase